MLSKANIKCQGICLHILTYFAKNISARTWAQKSPAGAGRGEERMLNKPKWRMLNYACTPQTSKEIISMSSKRVAEVIELMALLEAHKLHKAAALRTAVECVYGLRHDYFRRNFYKQTREEIDEINDDVWDKATDRLIQESPA
jgi:hypothetical protein